MKIEQLAVSIGDTVKALSLGRTRVRYGYRRVHVQLRREVSLTNHKKTRRIYRELGLQLRNKTPKTLRPSCSSLLPAWESARKL